VAQSGVENNHGASRIHHPATPLTPHPTPYTFPLPPPSPPPPTLTGNMANDIKLLIFRGIELEDPRKFWFVAKIDNDVKKVKLFTMLQEIVLIWYMNYSTMTWAD
jgi:hypothetical protein